jgi:hypothetical protein
VPLEDAVVTGARLTHHVALEEGQVILFEDLETLLEQRKEERRHGA